MSTPATEQFNTKWDDWDYRVMPVSDKFDWMRCQVGRKFYGRFELLGFGRTMERAEQMAERRSGR